jgi:hypothetical protein
MTTTTYAADRTALLIVDPYNDFMSEGGKLYEATRETAESSGFYDNMRTLIPAIRAARIQVVIVPHHRWRESDYAGWRYCLRVTAGTRAEYLIRSCRVPGRPDDNVTLGRPQCRLHGRIRSLELLLDSFVGGV